MDRKEYSELLTKHKQKASVSKSEVMRRVERSFIDIASEL